MPLAGATVWQTAKQWRTEPSQATMILWRGLTRVAPVKAHASAALPHKRARVPLWRSCRPGEAIFLTCVSKDAEAKGLVLRRDANLCQQQVCSHGMHR